MRIVRVRRGWRRVGRVMRDLTNVRGSENRVFFSPSRIHHSHLSPTLKLMLVLGFQVLNKTWFGNLHKLKLLDVISRHDPFMGWHVRFIQRYPLRAGAANFISNDNPFYKLAFLIGYLLKRLWTSF